MAQYQQQVASIFASLGIEAEEQLRFFQKRQGFWSLLSDTCGNPLCHRIGSLSIHLRTGKFGNLISDDFTSLELLTAVSGIACSLCCFLCCSSLRVVLG